MLGIVETGKSGSAIVENIENLLTVTLIKFKKPSLTKFQNLDFMIVNFFKTDFLTFKAKKTFIYL